MGEGCESMEDLDADGGREVVDGICTCKICKCSEKLKGGVDSDENEEIFIELLED